jgi:DNA polymerase/3'-5' exonuclease PolX
MSSTTDKPRIPRANALAVAGQLCNALKAYCAVQQNGDPYLIVAGSLRRRKADVGDVEILFVPKFGMVTGPGSLFAEHGNMADCAIAHLVELRVLAPRLSKTGSAAMGPKNKLMVHLGSDIPVDLFTATEANWWNYLVCRTGGAENNVMIAQRAREQGYKWNPYGAGFTRLRDGERIPMTSERQVFEFLSIPYLDPWERS